MATKRLRSWFFQGVSTILGVRFRTNNKPTQETFEDFAESIIFKKESGDTATETVAGHVKIANKDAISGNIDIDTDGFQLVVKPTFLPIVDLFPTDTTLLLDDIKDNGINVKNYLSVEGRMEYILKALIDLNYLKFNNEKEITFADAIVTLLDTLSGLIDEETGDIVVELSDFIGGMFDGGLKNVGGVLTVDTDDLTMEVDAATHKVQLKDNGVTLAKMATLTPGDVIVGQIGSGNPIAVNIAASNHILIGNGIGVSAVNLNTLLSAITIANNSITAVKMHTSAFGDGLNRDADEMFVDLAPGASLEFADGKLKLIDDEDLTGYYIPRYYGTEMGTWNKGYYSLRRYSEIYSEEFTLGGADTTITILAQDILNLVQTSIKALELDISLYIKTGSEPYYYTKQTDIPVVQTTETLTEPIVEQIDFTGLTPATIYQVVITYRRIPTPI